MKTPFFMFPLSRCLSKEMLDTLIVAKHRLSEENKDAAMNHLQDCSKCRARCMNRVASLTGSDQVGVLQPDGFRSAGNSFRNSPYISLPGIGASVAAVGILGVAFLSPLFLQRSAQIVTPQVRQQGASKAATTPSNLEIKKQMLIYMATQIKGLEEKINQIDAELKGKNSRLTVQPDGSIQLYGSGVVRSNASKTGVRYYSKGATSSKRVVVPSVRRKVLQQQRMMLQKKLVETKALALHLKNMPPEKLIENADTK